MRSAQPLLVGRAEYRRRLLDFVGAGLGGHPCAVLIHGEAGIGKTALARSACEGLITEGVQVLWGQCLRFGAVDAMYHPLLLALEGWLRQATVGQRSDMMAAVPSAALLLPSLGAPPASTPTGLMTVVDALVQHVVEQGPTVLVVDDVQWADSATWDVLTYLVAGFAGQQLALLATHRDEGRASEGFQRWLANLTRLPGTEELALGRLDLEQTSAQMAILLDGPVEPLLVADVFARSQGNPYFSELLARRADPASVELPVHPPAELSRALLDSWLRLSSPAREVTRVLAVGGRPTEVRKLTAIVGELGFDAAGGVREAIDGGVVVLEGASVWFRHPLLAAVLIESYLPGEADEAHAAWARDLQSTTSEGVDELRRLGDLALHHERAGEGGAAFVDLMAGAGLAEALGAPRETADLLVRAERLWDMSADRVDSIGRARLLKRAAEACAWIGRDRDAIWMMNAARDLLAPDADPLLAGHLRHQAAMFGWSKEDNIEVTLAALVQALELTCVAPDSREHAEALCSYADVMFWQGRSDDARQAVDASLAAATRSGSPGAIANALGVRALLALPRDLGQAEKDAAACWRYAAESSERWAIAQAFNVGWNLAETRGDLRRAFVWTQEEFDWFIAQGKVLWPSCDLALVSLDLGDLRTAESAIRAGLAATGSLGLEAEIRILAGLLAVRRTQDAQARGHLTRALELMPYLDNRPMQVSATRHADLLIELNEPEAAFELVERVLQINATDSRVLDALLLRGARAAADLVQRAQDGRDHPALHRHREALERLISEREALPGIPFQVSGPEDTQQAARAALFAAEIGRARGGEAHTLWQQAAQACGEAAMEWEQRLAQLRVVSALVESGAPSSEIAQALREIHGYADSQGATRLKARVEELAASAHVSLDVPTVHPSETFPAAFTGLTPREAEVLGHLIANRTYAEIAAALFIGEKTVSTHVSHLLRKTGTSSRREVAALARRVGWDAHP